MGISGRHEVAYPEKADQVIIRPVHVPSQEIKPSVSVQPENRSERDVQPGEKIPESVQDDDDKSAEDHEEWAGSTTRHSQPQI